MDLFEFEEAVKNGEITDVEPYMRKQDFDLHRMILAENGIEVDRIVKRDGKQVIVNLIEKGLETERYDTWKNHPNKKVREALAEQGYYPDLYINDKSPDVRREVIRQYPKLSLKRMHNHNDRFAIRWNLVRESNPDLEVLGTYLETVTKSELKETFAVSDIEALKLKHQALMTHPSPIEKTMAPYQLFEINSPLWTLSYTAIEVFNITHTYDELEPEYKQMDDCIKVLFDVQGKLINGYPHNIRVELRRQLRERNNMDLIEFEQAIINGEITDFRPYVDGGTFHENRNRKALCIKYGVAQELYPDWAQSDDPDQYDDPIVIS